LNIIYLKKFGIAKIVELFIVEFLLSL